MALITESGGGGNIRESGTRNRELVPRELDAYITDVRAKGSVVDPSEGAGEMDGMNADKRRDSRQCEPFGEMGVDEQPCANQPGWNDDAGPVGFPCRATRRFRQDAERDAFNREPRHLVAQPELTVQTMREMHDQPAVERAGRRQQRRLLTCAAEPQVVHVDDETCRARISGNISGGLVRAPEQQRRAAVGPRATACDFGQRAAENEHEARVCMEVAIDALTRVELRLGEHEAAHPPPA